MSSTRSNARSAARASQGRAALARERDAARVLVVGDRIEEFGAPTLASQRVQRVAQQVYPQAIAVNGDADHLALVARRHHLRAEVARRFHQRHITGIDEDLIEQVERLDPAAGHHHRLEGCRDALAPLQIGAEPVARAW